MVRNKYFGIEMGTSQQDYLRDVKQELRAVYPKLTWDQFADLVGIEPRAFKTYRMPESSEDYRAMDKFKRKAVEDFVAKAMRRVKKAT